MTVTTLVTGCVLVLYPEMLLCLLLLVPLVLLLAFYAGKFFGRGLYQEKLKMTRQMMVLLKESGHE